jgi:hypothetical protein
LLRTGGGQPGHLNPRPSQVKKGAPESRDESSEIGRFSGRFVHVFPLFGGDGTDI